MKVAELLNYATDICNIPISYWRNDSVAGNAAKQADDIYDTSGSGDMRRIMLLKIVRALYSKTKCSFALPLALYKRNDVYYFPDGAAFCKAEKPTAFMAASIVAQNPDSRMLAVTRAKGLSYVSRGLALTDRPAGERQAAAAASGSNPEAVAKKRPAAAKAKLGAATKQKHGGFEQVD